MRLCIEVSPGEAIDKLTILAIKEDRLTEGERVAHVRREAAALIQTVDPLLQAKPALLSITQSLREVNERLWEIEDALRLHEQRGEFGPSFIELARDVYCTNDRRAALKAEINALLGTDIAEQKSYAA